MRFFNIPVIGGVADFQVTFRHTPYMNSAGKINKTRKTECIVAIILKDQGGDFVKKFSRYANRTEKGDVKLYDIAGWNEKAIVIPIAYGIARTGSKDMFCRATGRKVAMGKAISALVRYSDREDRGLMPGKLPDFDISDTTAKALFRALDANSRN